MTNILVIDDLRSFRVAPEQVSYARTAEQAIAHLMLMTWENWTQVYFDHDLGEHGGDIWNVIAFLEFVQAIENTRNPTWKWEFQATVHSSNPPGAVSLVKALERLIIQTRRVDAGEIGLVVL